MGLVADLTLAAAFLSSGSINSITNKILYQTQGKNIGGEYQYFDRPWLNTFIMFCGEFLCMGIYGVFFLYYHYWSKADDNEDKQDIDEEALAEKKKYAFISREEVMRNPTGGLGWKYPLYITLFAFCDLLATTLAGIGLLFCSASIIQIIRGFVIVFTMLFAWPILHRKPLNFQLLGVCFALIGLFIVGASAVLSDNSGNTGSQANTIGNTILGIGLTLVGQLFSSTQFVLEEKLLKQDSGEITPIPPLFLVGSEGLAGAILSAAIALPVTNAIPGNDFGSYENMKNSFYMLFHNPKILGIKFFFFLSIAFFNWCGFVYSKALSATSRTLVDALRTIIVWIIMVICFYTTDAQYGEPVSYWSILQAVGFVFMLTGTVTHNDIGGAGQKIVSRCKKHEEYVSSDEIELEDEKKESSDEEKEVSTSSNDENEVQEEVEEELLIEKDSISSSDTSSIDNNE